MSTMEHKPMGLAGIVARCVLLTPKGVRPDADLLAALDRRDLTLVRHDSEFTAITSKSVSEASPTNSRRSQRSAAAPATTPTPSAGVAAARGSSCC